MVPQVPGIVGWLLASSCESSPLSPRPECRLGTLVGSPTRRKAFCFSGCEDIMPVVGQQSARLAPRQLELSDFEGKCILDFKEPKQEIGQGCQRIGDCEKAACLEWESDHQPHTPPPVCGKTARWRDSRGLAIPAPICSGLRWPLTALSERCWHWLGSCSFWVLYEGAWVQCCCLEAKSGDTIITVQQTQTGTGSGSQRLPSVTLRGKLSHHPIDSFGVSHHQIWREHLLFSHGWAASSSTCHFGNGYV